MQFTATHFNKTNFLFSGGPLLLVLFIDGMGLGLVFSILNALLVDPNSFIFLQLFHY